MAQLETLQIRGIRSFGTGTADEQKIYFASPITLLLGENGCGKTTVIECLKYALTGELPPNCNKGQSFVHDPNISNSSESLGQVKLMVKNKKNFSFTVTRSIKTTLKGNSIQFKTLDNAITIKHPDGTIETLSQKNTETNLYMSNIMGVSQAIINNVLFCHQEESNWPLESGQKLKEKFDSIFGTTEYNKAIDKIIKYAKNYEAQSKIKQAEIKLLQHLKKETESKNLELQKNEDKFVKIQENVNKCENELEPLKDRLVKIKTVELEISKLYLQEGEIKTKINKNKEHQASLLGKIKNKFSGSMVMLNQEIRAFKSNMEEKKRNLSGLEDDLSKLKHQEKRIQNTITDLDRKISGLIYQRQQEQEFHSERAKLLGDVCQKFGIEVFIDLENSNENIEDLLKKIDKAFKQENASIVDLTQSHDKVDSDLQKEIDKLRTDKTSIESNINSIKKQSEDMKKDKKLNQLKIVDIEKSAQRLQSLTNEIEEINKCYKNLVDSVNLDEIKKNLTDKRDECKRLQTQLDTVDKQMVLLNSIANITAELLVKENQLDARETEMKKMKSKHSENLKRLLNNAVCESNFKRRIHSVYQNAQREIADTNKAISLKDNLVTTLTMTRKTQRDELKRMEKEMTDIEEKIYEHCHSTPFQEVLERVKDNVAKYQLDHGALNASDVLYKKYMKKLDDEACCPLCHTEMTGTESGALVNELQEELRRLPENIVRASKLLKAELQKYEILLGLQPVTEKLEQLKHDIPKNKQTLKDTEDKLSAALSDSESLQVSLAEPRDNLELSNSMLGDMTLLDEAIKNIASLKEDVEKLKSKMPEAASDLSMDDVQLQRATIASELSTTRNDVDELQGKYDDNSNIMNKLREKRNKMEEHQIQLQKGVQSLTQLKATQLEIEQKIDKNQSEIQQLTEKLLPLNTELNEVIQKKEKTKRENREKLNVIKQKADDHKRIDTEIKRCSSELAKLAELNLAEQIELSRNTLQKHKTEQNEKAKEDEEVSSKIEQLRKEVSGQEILERDLLDNKELKSLENEGEELAKTLIEVSRDLGDLDFKSIAREKDSLIKQQDAIVAKRSELSGQMYQLKTQISSMKSELEQPQYRDAVKNYRQMYYDWMVLKNLVSDLRNYRQALEYALMNYHSEKMNRVNSLMKGLWHSIYRGNDIDYIQIKTDEMKSQASDKRRNYNYRVVQIKKDIELDMSGRCSAGQRVLACLIIRIALAETFSVNCGILALDEPTTNLDRNNIFSLVEALNKIVEERDSQQNFMLLVITHDEEFVTALGRVSGYFKVSRGSTGKSIIDQVIVQ